MGSAVLTQSYTAGRAHCRPKPMNDMMKVDVLEIPYKGAAPALNDLVSGQFHYMVDRR